MIPKTFGRLFYGLMRQKLQFLEDVRVITSECKWNSALQKNIRPIVKYDASSMMVWGCFASLGPGPLALTKRIMNSALPFKKSPEEECLTISL